MNYEYRLHLKKFYRNLENNFLLGEKLKNKGSLLTAFLDLKSNKRYSILDNSAIKSNQLPNDVIEILLEKQFIRQTANLENYVITALGIWDCEYNENILSIDKLLNNLDKKFFDLFQVSKETTEKEKIILFTMLTIRAFSDLAFLDLKKGEKLLDEMADLIESSYGILKKCGIIKDLKQENLFGSKGNEHPVSNLIRHTDALYKKTKGIFTAVGNQKYYLDLFKDFKISLHNLAFIIWLIFREMDTYNIENEILYFCNNNAYTKGIFLYDPDKLIFIKPEYDDILREAFFEFNLNKKKWFQAFNT